VPGYMAAGAEQWSTAQGKVCPGNRRIAQIPQIITRAQQITTPSPTMPATATLQEDPLSALSDAEQRELLDGIRALRTNSLGPDSKGWPLRDGSNRVMTDLDMLRDVQAQVSSQYEGMTMAARLIAVQKQNAVLQSALTTLTQAAAGTGVTAEQLDAVVRKAMADTVKVQVSVSDTAA